MSDYSTTPTDTVGTTDRTSRIKATAKELRTEVQQEAAERAQRIKGQAEDLRDEVQREVGERAQQVREWANVQADQVRTTVLEKPFASAGAAFAAGVVLGVLLARR